MVLAQPPDRDACNAHGGAINAADERKRERLLDAAEHLVARRGVSGVSLSEIMMEAGADSAAVNQHFGSKDALLTAVFYRRLHVQREGAEQILSAKAAEGRKPTIRDVTEAIVLPIAELAKDEAAGRFYLSFVMALQHYPPLAHLPVEGETWKKAVLKAYRQAAPHLAAGERRKRVDLAVITAVGAFSGGPANVWYGALVRPEGAAAPLLDFISSGLDPRT